MSIVERNGPLLASHPFRTGNRLMPVECTIPEKVPHLQPLESLKRKSSVSLLAKKCRHTAKQNEEKEIEREREGEDKLVFC